MKESNTYENLQNIITFLAVIAITGALAADEPRVFTVDNTGGPHADFTDLQEAMDAAEDGDIFHVLGSPVTYSHVTINRQVHLFGPGYNLARVHEEGYQDFYEARLGVVKFEPTSQTNTPAGSTMFGLRTSSVTISASDITVQHNHTRSISISTITLDSEAIEPHRTHILQNYVEGSVTAGSSSATGHVIANNIITEISGSFSTNSIRNATVRHNFIGDGSGGDRLLFQNSTVENNFLRIIDGSFSRDNLIRNNFVYDPKPDNEDFLSDNSLSDNLWDIRSEGGAWDELFAQFGAFDEQYRLADESQAKGAGVGGVDVGPFDGPFPYEISGVPSLPRVKIMAPGPFTVSPNSDLTIPVKIEVE